MTDVPDTADVLVGTPLGTSDHCFASCVVWVEQVQSTISEVLSSEALYQLGQCPVCSQQLCLEHHFEVS